jgi:hypothetical protein
VDIELRRLSVPPAIVVVLRLGLRLIPVLLLDRDRARSRSDLEDWDEAEDARRWRCIRVGSTSGIFARRANKERTDKKS